MRMAHDTLAGPQELRGRHRRLSLPWLDVDTGCDSADTLAQVERALFKVAAETTGGGLPLLRADFRVGAALDEARWVWENATLKYQFVRGVTAGARARFATGDGTLLELDFDQRQLDGRLSESTFSAPYSTWPDVVLAPLTEYWREHVCFPLHAAAISLEEEHWIVAGYSGSGKTTLSLACLAAGAAWRADDKLLFQSTAAGIKAVSLYRNTNLHPNTVAHFRELSFTLDRPPIDETNAKRPCLLEELPLQVDLTPFQPTALLFPAVADAGETSIRRLSPAEAHLRLAAQSPLSTHPPRMAAQVRALATVARSLPAFEVRSGRDVLSTPAHAARRLLRAVRESRC